MTESPSASGGGGPGGSVVVVVVDVDDVGTVLGAVIPGGRVVVASTPGAIDSGG